MPTDDLDATMARVRSLVDRSDAEGPSLADEHELAESVPVLLDALTTLRAEHERAMAVVEALPRCDVCDRPATYYYIGTQRPTACDEHHDEDEDVELDYAAALRALDKGK